MALALYQRYGSKTVWVTSGNAASDQTVSGSIQQLSRVQDVTYSINYPLRDNVYLDGAVEAFNTSLPSVDVDLRFWHTNGMNEAYCGLVKLNASGTAVMGLDEEKNLYVAVEDELGLDAIGNPYTKPKTVIGLGNAVMTSYELGAQVGGLIESRVAMNALTANVYTGFSGQRVPSVDYRNGGSATGLFILPGASSQYSTNPLATGQNVAALGSQEMYVVFSQNTPFGLVFTGQESCYLQSFNLGLTINRQEQKPLGYDYPVARPIIYPIQVDFTANATVSRYQRDRLDRLNCTTTGQAAQLIVKQPCSNLTLFGFYFNNLQLQSQMFTQGIGSLDTASLTWRGWINTPNDLFVDPYYNYLVNLDTTGAYGTQW